MLSCQTRIYFLSLEGATGKSFNFRLVASMHRLRSIPDPKGLIIIVLISLKDDRASTMGCKQISRLALLKEEKKKNRTSNLWSPISRTRNLGAALIIPVKLVLGSETFLSSFIISNEILTEFSCVAEKPRISQFLIVVDGGPETVLVAFLE